MALRLCVLGIPSVHLDEERCHFPTRKAEAILYYIAIEPGEHSRDELADIFWPMHSDPRQRLTNALDLLRNQGLSTAKRPHSGHEFVCSDRQHVWFRPEADACVDLKQFERLLDECERAPYPSPPERHKFHQAFELYRGPFLEGFYIDDSPEFEQWQRSRQMNAERRHLSALVSLAVYDAVREEYSQAINWLQAYLAVDPYSEPVQCLTMLLHCIRGEPHIAVQQYELHRKRLEHEGNVSISESMTSFYDLLTAGELDGQMLRAGMQAALGNGQTGAERNLTTLMNQLLHELGLQTYPALSREAQQALDDAREVAVQMRFAYVGVPHIFIALVQGHDPYAYQVLGRLGVEAREVIRLLEWSLGRGDAVSEQEIRLSPRARYSLDRAQQKATQAGTMQLETHHILDAILESETSLLVRVLRRLGAGSLHFNRNGWW